MSLHDAYGRLTPYELSLPGRGFAEERFRALEREAEERGVELGDPGAFVLLEETGRLLEEVTAGGEDAELMHQYGALLFHGYHFWSSGEPFFLLGTPVARYLVEAAPSVGEWAATMPCEAGYVQLPRHLFWSGAAEDAPAEPLDGFFWTGGPSETVSFLVAMGMRDDRPGLSVATLPPLPLRDARAWLAEPARTEGDDFATTLPGGELDRLYSVLSTGEILKLAARTFWYLDRFPASVGDAARGEAAEGGPRASTLAFRRVRLGEPDEERP